MLQPQNVLKHTRDLSTLDCEGVKSALSPSHETRWASYTTGKKRLETIGCTYTLACAILRATSPCTRQTTGDKEIDKTHSIHTTRYGHTEKPRLYYKYKKYSQYSPARVPREGIFCNHYFFLAPTRSDALDFLPRLRWDGAECAARSDFRVPRYFTQQIRTRTGSGQPTSFLKSHGMRHSQTHKASCETDWPNYEIREYVALNSVQ